MSGWPEVELGEICEFKYGKSLPAEARDGGPFPVYGSNGVVGSHSAAITGAPVVIIGRKGSFGEIEYSTSPCWPIDTTYFVDSAATKTDLKWLSYRLRGLGLTTLNRAAAIPGLNREDAYRQRLLLPPLDEQRRIAAILDQADALRAKRRQVLAHFDILKRAIFDEMFGDLPWNGRLDDLVEVQIGPFGSLLHQEDYVTGGVPLLNPMHIRNGLLEPDSEFSVSELKASTLSLYRLREDDIVLGRRGEMGRAGIVLAQHRGMLCGTGSLILRPRGGDSHFLHALITSSRMKEHLEREALGATLPNLNSKIVKSAPAPIVPADAQDRFALKIRAVDRLTREAERLLRSVEYLFAALQSRAFRGEL